MWMNSLGREKAITLQKKYIFYKYCSIVIQVTELIM